MVKVGTAPGFNIYKGSGFHITFHNGWTVSVQFGPGNYCDNYNLEDFLPVMKGEKELPASASAEIAAWDKNGEWYDFGDDQVRGYQNPEEVLLFMAQIAAREQ